MSEIPKLVNSDGNEITPYDPCTIPGYNYLAAIYPDVAKCLVYNPSRESGSEMDRSIEMCDWKCPDCQGLYTAFMQDVIFCAAKGRSACPYCNETQVLPAFNSVKVKYPDVAKLWSHRNKKTADQVLPRSTELALWVCSDCYNEYEATILSMTSGEMKCPYCTGWKTLPGVSPFSTKHLDVVDLWSSRNKRTASEVNPASAEDFIWNCPECHGEFKSTIQRMMTGEASCPYCNNRRVLPGFNSLAAKCPDIAWLWSSQNAKTADEVLYNSAEIALWICPECRGEFSSAVGKMSVGGGDCPYCNDRRVLPGYNSLAARYPEIARLWSPQNTKSADEVLYNARESALWLCPECHGEFSSPVEKMTVGDGDCPYCNNRRVLPGFNSFAAKHKDLLVEWDYVSNYILADPDQILDSCQIPVWWKCPENKDHEYRMSPETRLTFQVRKKKSCPYCKGLRRKKRHFI